MNGVTKIAVGIALLCSASCSEVAPYGGRDAPPRADAESPRIPGQPDATITADGALALPDAQPLAPGDAAVPAPPAHPPPPDDPARIEALRSVVETLASDAMQGREEGSAGGIAARNFIVDELTRCGVAPAGTFGYEQPIVTGNGANVLGRIEGTDPARSRRTIVLGAHYDHVGRCDGAICNGANDNAAGVAIALGVACAIAAAPLPRSVLFAAWDAEEPPTFLTSSMGSEYYAAHAGAALGDIDVAIALDLVGGQLWPGFAGHFLAGGESSTAVGAAIDALVAPVGLEVLRASLHQVEETPFGHQPWSDYDAFRNRGVPVVFLSNGQNKHYHEATDEADTLDYTMMMREEIVLLELVRRLGEATETPAFNAAGDHYAGDASDLGRVVEAALAPGGLVDSLSLTAGTRTALERDRENLRGLTARLASGAAVTPDDVRILRAATQRLMCLTGPTYPEVVCGVL